MYPREILRALAVTVGHSASRDKEHSTRKRHRSLSDPILIATAKKHPDADSLYVEEVDVGEVAPRTVVSGLVNHVPLEQMQNRMVVLRCNLKPVKMRGVLSQAVVMCASSPEKVEILAPPNGSVPGDRITFAAFPGMPDKELNPKKKIWEQIQPDLHTNDECVATYKGVPFEVKGKGVLKP
nr:aminoacyl tRNA synthase complex-interacting multifunctional protein 1-like [Saimiri boliviensis boliviensis]